MLVLTRKANQAIRIGCDVEVTVLSVHRGQVKLGIAAPRGVAVHRREVADRANGHAPSGANGNGRHRLVETIARQEPRRRAIRILVADDNACLRAGLCCALDDQPDMEVVAEAADGLEAVEKALATRPDVVLIDLMMPRLGGVEATRRITAALPGVRVIALTGLDGEAMAAALKAAGAAGFLTKGGSPEELFDALRPATRPTVPR